MYRGQIKWVNLFFRLCLQSEKDFKLYYLWNPFMIKKWVNITMWKSKFQPEICIFVPNKIIFSNVIAYSMTQTSRITVVTISVSYY